ncbi:hypothetical protein NLI96_g4077 [Meripilus lineatus]|uniref:Uncharacterized protein n=1 Tax=Meripilus lineatus TaxID=2056292 RepID=A0AAD5YK92_9APHY|nr:hypothetical protein NLI96_g4077 [Physisporinus lineatus]
MRTTMSAPRRIKSALQGAIMGYQPSSPTSIITPAFGSPPTGMFLPPTPSALLTLALWDLRYLACWWFYLLVLPRYSCSCCLLSLATLPTFSDFSGARSSGLFLAWVLCRFFLALSSPGLSLVLGNGSCGLFWTSRLWFFH